MSEIILCDRCNSLLSSKNTYRLIITLQQTAGVLEVNQSDLKKDLIEEIEKTIEELTHAIQKNLRMIFIFLFQPICVNVAEINLLSG